MIEPYNFPCSFHAVIFYFLVSVIATPHSNFKRKVCLLWLHAFWHATAASLKISSLAHFVDVTCKKQRKKFMPIDTTVLIHKMSLRMIYENWKVSKETGQFMFKFCLEIRKILQTAGKWKEHILQTKGLKRS